MYSKVHPFRPLDHETDLLLKPLFFGPNQLI